MSECLGMRIMLGWVWERSPGPNYSLDQNLQDTSNSAQATGTNDDNNNNNNRHQNSLEINGFSEHFCVCCKEHKWMKRKKHRKW